MSNLSFPDCFICRKQCGDIAVPGGAIFENDLIYISHAQVLGEEKDHYLGHVFVESKRHVAELADLTAPEASAIGLYSSRVARALLQTLDMEHIYTFFLADGVPHVHIHIIGRYTGTPRQYWGLKVDEWPLAPRGTNANIAHLADRLRAFLNETND